MHRILTGPLTIESVTVAIAGLPDRLQGTTLVHLSDLHYDGFRLSETLLQQAIAATNRANPDLILLTGDYVTDDPEPIHDLAQRLQSLSSRAGIYAVLGNHDLCYRHSQTQITQALTAIGIQVLWNQIAYPLGADIALVGLADMWSREFNPQSLLSQLPLQLPRIVLSHNPDSAVPLQAWRVDLQLSGHTHGGQVVIPGLGTISQWLDPVRRKVPKSLRRGLPLMRKCHKVVQHWEWAQGLHRIGDHTLYVNRGLGTYFPGRLFCPPEVTVITLTGKPTPDAWGAPMANNRDVALAVNPSCGAIKSM
ncbi:metallophosphoesterase [Neosynechococcus sphagnicola]|uniref:metallophosphoesterase n=1 Tax=Neosynechococcus sphagnicola TaxID=1501145 RepID=UPI000907AD7E|nr:metallophosphoesterase [Neosynechococcus sphagnicola]